MNCPKCLKPLEKRNLVNEWECDNEYCNISHITVWSTKIPLQKE